MENIIWYVIMIPCSLILTGIGVFAWNREKPMWFWIGNEIKASEISDVKAYNHANGLMWGLYSLVFWAATVAGTWINIAALILIAAGCVVGIPVIIAVYGRICRKYKVGA